jgi:SNF2 family DNA or RNA helicase
VIVVEISDVPDRPFSVARPLGYAQPINDLAREIPGLAWDPEAKGYAGWPDAVAAFAHALVEENLAVVVGIIQDPADRLAKRTSEGLGPSSPSGKAVRRGTGNGSGASTPRSAGSLMVPFMPKELRPYQREGVEFMRLLAPESGALLAWDVGLGKTVGVLTAMRAMIERDGLPKVAVVIGPSITKPIWAAESLKWHPGIFRPIVLEGTKGIEKSGYPFLRDHLASNVPGIPLVILNYDIAHAWAGTLTKFKIGVLACDEAHMLQEARSRRSRAVREIVLNAAHATIMLSGTPMQTRPKDLWNVIDTMTPGRFGFTKDAKPDPWKFYRRYCDAKRETIARDTVVWNINGSSHEEELNLRLRWVMTRKSKADVLTDLPPRIRQTIQIQIPGSYVLPIWESGERMRKDALSEALSMSGVGKAGASIDLASDRIAEGHSVLIFTHRRETAKRIFNGEKREKLKGVSGLVKPGSSMLITGDVPVAERTKGIKNLRGLSATSPVVIVATIDSVGVGMDISFCDVVIFNDLDWVPSKLLQAEGRAHRHGAKGESVLIYYLIGVGTADEYIQSKVISRLDLYEKVIGGQAEAKGLKEDLERMNTASEEEILADLRRAVLAGEVLPEEDGL